MNKFSLFLAFTFFISISLFVQGQIIYSPQSICFPAEYSFSYIPENGETLHWDSDNDGFYDDGDNNSVSLVVTQPDIEIGLKILNTKGETQFISQSFTFYKTPEVQLIERSNCTDRPSFFDFKILNNIPENQLSYEWRLDNNIITLDENTHSVSEAGDHLLELSVDNSGCTVTVDSVISISPPPTADFEAMTFCARDSFDLLNQSQVNNGELLQAYWSLKDIASGGNKEKFSLKIEEPGVYPVKLTVYSSELCVDSIIKEIEILPYPEYTITPDKFITLYEGESKFIEIDGDFTEIIWEDGNHESDRNFSEDGNYLFEVSNNLGCSVSDSIVVQQLELPELTLLNNVITPNGDGVNDFLKVQLAEQIQNISLQVYGRDASLLYETANYNNNWNGDNLPTGTYFYRLSLGNQQETGEITILND